MSEEVEGTVTVKWKSGVVEWSDRVHIEKLSGLPYTVFSIIWPIGRFIPEVAMSTRCNSLRGLASIRIDLSPTALN